MGKTRWFVEAVGDTNESIAQALSQVCQVEVAYDMIDDKGVRRDVWEVEHQLITKLKKCKVKFNFQYRIFKRDGNYGPIKEWFFENRRKRSKKVKKAADFARQSARTRK